MTVSGRSERGRRALEGIEHHQSPRTRQFFCARDDRLDIGRMQYQRECFGGGFRKLREPIQHCGQFIFMRRPARGAKSGSHFQYDCIDDRIAIENAQNLVEVALMHPAADGAARIERIAIAAADDVEERFQFVVRNPTGWELRAARSRRYR